MKLALRSTLIMAGLLMIGAPFHSFAQPVATTFATGITDPKAIIDDGAGNLVIADFGAGTTATSVLDLVSPAGVVTTLTPGNSGLDGPYGLVSLGGLYYVVNYSANSIATVNPTTGVVTAFPTTGVALNFPGFVVADSGGNLYVANNGTSIVKIPTAGPSAGVATTLATPGGSVNGLTIGLDGNIYFTGSAGISRMTLAGAVTPFASSGLFNNPLGIAVGPDHNFYVVNEGGTNVLKVTQAGEVSVYATGFNVPWALGFNGTNLYVSNDGNASIAQVPAPPPFPIPALSGWAMILASILLGGTGVVFATRSGRMAV